MSQVGVAFPPPPFLINFLSFHHLSNFPFTLDIYWNYLKILYNRFVSFVLDFRCFVKISHREDFDKLCEEKLGGDGERLKVGERLKM